MKISKYKVALLVFGTVLLTKIIIALVALPKVTVDYVAQYNELTKPVDFIPGKNAADYYQKAYEFYVKPSEGLFDANVMFSGEKAQAFANIDPNELELLEDWIASNKTALEQAKLAIPKPYCWYERKSEKGDALGITFPESHFMNEISQLFTCSAKLNAFTGDLKSATDNILNCYRVGQHQCRENLSMVEQYSGLRIKSKAIEMALDILSFAEFTPEELSYFQDSFQAMMDNDIYIAGVSAEKVFQYDTVQRVYLDWIRGINKPAFRVLYGIRCLCGDNNFLWVQAFVGPSRQKVLRQTDRLFELYDQLRDKTPWQIQHQCVEQVDEIKTINESNFFMEMFGHPCGRLFFVSQETKAEAEALITILAILRYKADNNRLPETLDELISKGYMKNLPQDPYSENAMVYKVTDEDFTLYSLGRDFEDNNGEPVMIDSHVGPRFNTMDLPGMSLPPSNTIKRPFIKDIVYWPKIKEPFEYKQIGF